MFYRLILAHLIGDFVLQNRWLVKRKRTPLGLAIHVSLVGLAMLPVTWGQLDRWWPWLCVILVVHALTDWGKIKLEPRLGWPPIVLFLIDQGVHLLALAGVVVLAQGGTFGLDWRESEPFWWIASAYLVATYLVSIALPLWLDPSSLMRRPLKSRVTLILISALVLTLAWRGLPLLIPMVGVALYQVVARRLARNPVTATFAIEFWSAVVLAACLGWSL